MRSDGFSQSLDLAGGQAVEEEMGNQQVVMSCGRKREGVGAVGGEAVRGFCSHCGASLFFAYIAEPERIWMTLGCFDDPAAHRPVEDWYCDGRMPWVRLDSDSMHWPAAPGWVAEVTGQSKGRVEMGGIQAGQSVPPRRMR